MKKLMNVLYVTAPDSYLSLDGATVVVTKEEGKAIKMPLLNLENIVCFGYAGVSPGLMGACADQKIGLCFLTPYGRFLGRVTGRVQGNVLLRKKQYQVSEDDAISAHIAASFLVGKITNCRRVINRVVRDHAVSVNVDRLIPAATSLKFLAQEVKGCKSPQDQMALEGSAGKIYFSVFDEFVLHQKDSFYFVRRSRRPPMDNLNSLLSFLYTLLTWDVASALEAVGLDPYVGFLHQDRPGRPSLALDLMEELRPVFADRLALSLVNRKQITGKGFVAKESGGILMDDETRKTVLTAWQQRKQQAIPHPFLGERMPLGLVPHVQALLLARYLRGDLDAYPPFFWN